MKRLILLLSLALILPNADAQNTLVKRIQYDVQINSEAQNEIVSLHNIPASTRLDFLNALFESVKKGETKAYTLQHNNSVPVYTEIKKKEVGKLFESKKQFTIQIRNPFGDPDDPYDVVDSTIYDDFEVTPNDISYIRFIEKWEEDAEGRIFKTIESFAPIYSKNNKLYKSYTLNLAPVFWVKSIGMKKQSWTMCLLSETQIRNEVSDTNWFVSNIEAPYRIEWMTRVFEDVKAGKIKAFKYYDSKIPLSQGVVDSIFVNYYDVYVYDDEFIEETLITMKYEIQPNEITKLLFYEVWTIDSKIGFRKEIVYFALISLNIEEFDRELFWIRNQPVSP